MRHAVVAGASRIRVRAERRVGGSPPATRIVGDECYEANLPATLADRSLWHSEDVRHYSINDLAGPEFGPAASPNHQQHGERPHPQHPVGHTAAAVGVWIKRLHSSSSLFGVATVRSIVPSEAHTVIYLAGVPSPNGSPAGEQPGAGHPQLRAPVGDLCWDCALMPRPGRHFHRQGGSTTPARRNPRRTRRASRLR